MRFFGPLLALTGLAAATTKIMPLGDSITGSPGCWRALLWQQLQAAGYTDIDFVGSLPGQGCGFEYDGENEGHGGYLVTNVANQNLLPTWLSTTHPDVVIMHFGTNDVWSNISPQVILQAFSKLLEQMREDNCWVKLFVAQILPMAPTGCNDCAQRVIDFNAAIPEWAKSENITGSEVYVVDQWTGFDTATDTYDGVHPNEQGNVKIAEKWFDAMVNVLEK